MDLTQVMDELATQLLTISGMRSSSYPPDAVNVPHAFPDLLDSSTVTFDMTYQRGMDQVTFLLQVAVSTAWSRTAWLAALGYVSGSGATSVKACLESGTYTAFDVVTVPSAEFDEIEIAGIKYVTVKFTVTVTGQGS